MKTLLGFLAFLLIAQGIGAIAGHFGWFELWGLVHRVGVLDGHELYAGILLLVLGLAVGGLAERAGS